MQKPTVLIIDDEESIRTQMKWALMHDYSVYLASDAAEALDIVRVESPPLITLDLGLPPDPEGTSEGMRLLGDILRISPSAKIIVVSGNAERSVALDAVARGAHDYLTKPLDVEELKSIFKRAHYVHTLESEYRTLQRQVETGAFGEIIGESPGIQEVFEVIRKVSTTDVPVLITGASGTGKELIARAIHTHSARQKKAFVTINCGAIPENLMESELFGHEKGAFTGAHIQRKGKIEHAEGGTFFLDEVGELPPSLQVKLLRFLQDHIIERVGGREAITVDTRVIAATNQDLKKLIKTGAFREDLYYRLAVISIDLPPLTERGEDVILLARTFLHRYTPAGEKPKAFSDRAVGVMRSYTWPGNIRELENRVRRAVTLSNGGEITDEDLGLAEAAPLNKGFVSIMNLKEAKVRLEKELIEAAMEKYAGNIKKASEELGITRPTLYNLMKKHDITYEDQE